MDPPTYLWQLSRDDIEQVKAALMLAAAVYAFQGATDRAHTCDRLGAAADELATQHTNLTTTWTPSQPDTRSGLASNNIAVEAPGTAHSAEPLDDSAPATHPDSPAADGMSPSAGAQLTAHTRFSVAAHLWLEQCRVDAENGIYSFATIDTYHDHLNNHVLPTLGELPLAEIKPYVVNALCQRNLKTHSVSLAKHTKAVVANVMTYAIQAGVLDRNPTRDIDRLSERRAKTKKRTARALTTDQVLDLFAQLDTDQDAKQGDLPDLVRYLIATGERIGEALGAQWSDFDPANQTLTMTGNIIHARGKGFIRNDGKSQTAQRTIPLPAWCVTLLLGRQAKLGELDPSKPIFPNTKGGYRSSSNLNNRHWLPFRKRAGYEWVTFHTLRKTVATLLDDAGLTARQIADILGHANPSMTQNAYMGRGQTTRAGAQALDKIISQNKTGKRTRARIR